MKVLFVSSASISGKVSPVVNAQGNSLINKGINLDYFSISNGGIRGYLKAIKILRRHLNANKYNIIHAHYGLSAIVALLAKKKQRLIVSFMGDDIIGAKNSVGKVVFSSRILVFFNKLLANHIYSYNIVKSKEMLRGLNIKKTSVIPNGVDFRRFYQIRRNEARELLRIDENKKIVIFVSDPKRNEKNYKAAKESVDLLNITNLELKVVSGIEHNDLIKYINSADALILTSFHEGSPNVIKEAMTCNIPIVSTDVGDVKEVIEKTDGCYITSFEAKDIAENIKKTLAFGKRTSGREDIKHLEASVIATIIINIYNKVLDK